MTEDMLHNRSTIALLEKLGLSKNEVKCYLAVLALGPSKVSEIAKMAQVHRVNTYDAVKKLIGRGLLEQEITKQGCRFQSASLEALKLLAQEHQKNASKLRWRIEDLVPLLTMSSSRQEEKPQLLIFDGSGALITIFERHFSLPSGSEILEFGLFREHESPNIKDYVEERYTPERIERKYFKRLLCLKNERYSRYALRDSELYRERRFLPVEFTNAIGMCNSTIYGDEVGLYWQVPQPMGCVIKNPLIADIMRMLFNIIWEKAEKIKTKTRS